MISKARHFALQNRRLLAWGAGVLLIALAQRLVLLVSSWPVNYSDTNSYRRLADAILNHWKGYDGTRTPGYPYFMAIFGSDQNVFRTQLILGLLITAIFFYIGWRVSHSPVFGALLALAHTLNLGQALFEANLLTETLTTFWLALVLLGVFLWLERPAWRNLFLTVGIGVGCALAALTRPLFIFMPVWVGAFLVVVALAQRPPRTAGEPGLPIIDPAPLLDNEAAEAVPLLQSLGQVVNRLRESRRVQETWYRIGGLRHGDVFRHLLGVLTPAVVLIGGWMLYVNHSFGIVSLTTMNGYILVQHTGNFFEYVPDQYSSLRDVYLKYRNERIAQYGTQGNTIWDAIPEMERVSGYGFYELSQVLTTISLRLIREHPDLYIRNLLQGWWMFWWAPVYWNPGHIGWELVRNVLAAAIPVERILLVGANLVFVGLSLLVAAGWRWLRKRSPFTGKMTPLLGALRQMTFGRMLAGQDSMVERIAPLWIFLAGTVWLTSVVQTILDHGDNPRFLVPLQTWVVLWLLGLGWSLFKSWADRLPKADSRKK